MKQQLLLALSRKCMWCTCPYWSLRFWRPGYCSTGCDAAALFYRSNPHLTWEMADG